MHILLVNQYAGSPVMGMEFRPYYLAREWVRAGHQVTVIAASYSHLRYSNPAVTSGSTTTIDGITYRWIKVPRYEGNGLKRLLGVYAFSWNLWAKAERYAGMRPDVVIASSTHNLDIYGARRIARLSAAPLIYEVHDLWPLTLTEVGGLRPWNPFVLHVGHAERLAYKQADKVVSMLSDAQEHMVSRGMDARKFIHIPNGFSAAEWASESIQPQDEAGAREPAPAARFRLGYAGGHGYANALEDLIRAATELRDLPIEITLIGGGPKKSTLQELAASLGLANVVFCPPVPKERIPQTLASFDALYLGWEPRPIYRFGTSPNKLIDYMMAARPIVHAHVGSRCPVCSQGLGLCAPAGDPHKIALAIQALSRLPAPDRAMMGARARSYAALHFEYGKLAQDFVSVMEDALDK